MIGLWLMDMSKVVDDIADFKVGFGESIAKTLESESLTAGAISHFTDWTHLFTVCRKLDSS